MSFLRPDLDRLGVSKARDIRDESRFANKVRVSVAGVVLVRQRPGTASGIVFMTIEDETGIANLIIRPKVYERYRAAAKHSVFIRAIGRVERSGSVVHLQVSRVMSLDAQREPLAARSRDFH